MEKISSNAEQLLEAWSSLLHEQRIARFLDLSRAEVDNFFYQITARDQAELILALSETDRKYWLRSLSPDDAADVLQQAGEDHRSNLLALLDKPSQAEVIALLAYKDDAAGGVMTPRFGRLRREMTVDAAISYLRHQAADLETIYYAYALDQDQRLVGVVSIRQLLKAERGMLIEQIMEKDLTYATEELDQEQLARIFSDQGLLAVPVVDSQMRMKGIVTVDDIVEVVQEEASEDIQKVGGSVALDAPYLQTGFLEMLGKRAGWLSVLFLGETLTASVMANYENDIAKAVVLTLFLPLIISSGGNSGSQATTLVIQAMAMGELRLTDWFRVVKREIASGFALGCALALIAMLRILGWQWWKGSYGEHAWAIAICVSLSLIGVVMFGTVAGSMLPFLLRRIGLDPASASAPFVATLVDVMGVVIYFTAAETLLRGRLL
jgi:magnesium transporter